jgi:hypothetical protein
LSGEEGCRRLHQDRGRDAAWFGGLFGLMVGAAEVLAPGLGPLVVAGSLAAAVLAGLEGALAGTALGGLAGALVDWGIPKERALTYGPTSGAVSPGHDPRGPRGRRVGSRSLRPRGPRAGAHAPLRDVAAMIA